MRILGIDSGSRVLGYGLIEAQGEALSYVECGVLTASAGREKYQRLAEIGGDLERLIAELEPDVVAMEAGFIGAVRGHLQQGALVSAAARGMAGFLAARAGLRVVEYAPATVKLSATGKGNADKATVAKFVTLTLGLKNEPRSDAADALAIAVCHARHIVIERRAHAA